MIRTNMTHMAHVRIAAASASTSYSRRASAPVQSRHRVAAGAKLQDASVHRQELKAQRSLSLNDIKPIPEEQRQDLKEAFRMFQSRKGKISARDLGPLLRCLGLNPSERDLEEARHELDVGANGRMTYTEVERYIMKYRNAYNEETEDILQAFKVLDKCGTGRISVSDFRKCMTTMGDKMTLEEVEEILDYAKTANLEFIEYEDLLKQLNNNLR